MNVSIIIPFRRDERGLDACLEGALLQRYSAGEVEVLAVQYGSGATLDRPPPAGDLVRFLAVDHQSPYAARNLGALHAHGDIFLFTEPGCVAQPEWASAHVERLQQSSAAISVGTVAPARMTRLLALFLSYEARRDEWVFSQQHWRYYFGQPKNMAVARRCFLSHGPFAEVARGSDSRLVQIVAREVSPDVVCLAPRAEVRQSAVRGLPSCLEDRFAHGYRLARHRSSHAAPLAPADRLGILRDAARRHRYGPIQIATLWVLLVAGIVVFRLAGLVGNLSRRMGVDESAH